MTRRVTPDPLDSREDVADWLPGSAIHALVGGGNETLSYGTVLPLLSAYAVTAVIASLAAFRARDTTA